MQYVAELERQELENRARKSSAQVYVMGTQAQITQAQQEAQYLAGAGRRRERCAR